jgi:predicted transcriptional regulator
MTAPIGGTMPKLSAVVPDDIAVALKKRARTEDRSVGAVIRRAIAEHVRLGRPDVETRAASTTTSEATAGERR